MLPEEVMVDFLERLQQLIGDADGAITEVARACGVSQPAVSQWKAGATRPSSRNLAALGRLRGLSQWQIDDLQALKARAETAEPVKPEPAPEPDPTPAAA